MTDDGGGTVLAGNFNPDVADPRDLRAWAVHLARVGVYCTTKAEAMTYRANGDIRAAAFRDNICDQIYKSLPDDWRW